MSVSDDLERLFPGHRSTVRSSEWEGIKSQLVFGQHVIGEVVAKFPFGACLDLGVGFPALLEIPVIADLTPEKYRAGDWCPVGSQVTARIGGFRDQMRQIGLWQIPVRKGPG